MQQMTNNIEAICHNFKHENMFMLMFNKPIPANYVSQPPQPSRKKAGPMTQLKTMPFYDIDWQSNVQIFYNTGMVEAICHDSKHENMFMLMFNEPIPANYVSQPPQPSRKKAGPTTQLKTMPASPWHVEGSSQSYRCYRCRSFFFTKN